MAKFEDDFEGFLEDLDERCGWARTSQFEAARYWDRVNHWLGLAAVFAGVLGGVSATGTAAWGLR